MPPKKPIVALAQIKYFETSKIHNLKKILKYIQIAKKKNADIICFPESCIHKSSLELNSKFIKIISQECKKNSIWCIVTDDIEKGGKVYNISLLIDREGKIKGQYKKIHLYGDLTSAGRNARVFQTDFGKIGIAICWDLAFPDLFRKMKKLGAQIVFCPSQWWYDSNAHYKDHKKREVDILRSLLLSRAYENIFFVALCNPVMDSKLQVSYSAIASPIQILNEKIHQEGLIIQEINLNEISRIQKIYEE